VTATLIASDAFGRSVSNGWGSADLGGAWTRVGSASNFAVSGGGGKVTMATKGSGPGTYLAGVSSSDSDSQITFALDKAATGGGVFTSLIGRRVDGVGDYRAKVHFLANGSVTLAISYYRADNVEVPAVPETTISGLSSGAGDSVTIRFQATGTGTTMLRASVWKAGTTPPATWQVSASDTTAGMQTTGGVGIALFLSGTATNAPVVATFQDLKVYKSSTLPAAMALRTGNMQKLAKVVVTK